MIFPYYQTPAHDPSPLSTRSSLGTAFKIRIDKHTAEYTSTSPTPHTVYSHTCLTYTITQDTITIDRNGSVNSFAHRCTLVFDALRKQTNHLPHRTHQIRIFARCESLCLRYPHAIPTPESSIPSLVVPKKPYPSHIYKCIC